MSADGSQFDLATITFDLQLHDYLALPGMILLYWDHVLTFRDELRFLWLRPKTPSTYCFLANRYIAFFGDIVILYFTFNTTAASACRGVNLFRQLLLMVNQSLICVLLTVRLYALYGRGSRLWMYFAAAALGLLALAMWGISGRESYPLPNVNGCHLGNSFDAGVHLAVPWEALFLYDCMIAVALFWKSFTSSKTVAGRRDTTLLGLLIRDGAIYFLAMATANLGNILTFYLTNDLLRGCLSTFASCLSVTMMSRLMLNLHAIESKGIFSSIATIDYGYHNKYTTSDSDTRRIHEGPELDTLWTRDMERSAYWTRDDYLSEEL
uniref:DUF6533 domain-containing protein n=1 Tax=Mycena chlorophos TaxID=658473 RepID=A0ABQ0LLD3_MYCCL|nr:predicted protein [Mycena chlorophos]